jgi:hypothetical protein
MSSVVCASPTSSGGVSCNCLASWTPSPSRHASETPDSRARHVHEALADVWAELEALFAKDASSTPTLPPLLCLDDFRVGDVLVHLLCGHRFCWACVQQWLKGSRGAPSVRRCGRRQRHQPPQPRIGGAVLHTRGRREITEGRALQSFLPFFRTSR